MKFYELESSFGELDLVRQVMFSLRVLVAVAKSEKVVFTHNILFSFLFNLYAYIF